MHNHRIRMLFLAAAILGIRNGYAVTDQIPSAPSGGNPTSAPDKVNPDADKQTPAPPVSTNPDNRTNLGPNEVKGTVLSIEQGDVTSRVKLKDAQGGTLEFTLDNKATFMRGGHTVPLSEINLGDDVSLNLDKR